MSQLTLSPDWILQHRFNLFPNKAYQAQRSKNQCIAQLSDEIKAAKTLHIDIPHSSEFLEYQFRNDQEIKELKKQNKKSEIKTIKKEQNKKSSTIRRQNINSHHKSTLLFQNSFTSRINRFWTNHFSIESKQKINRAMSVSYPNESIFPNVFGRFENLLNSAVLHPSMLKYLNNETSTGPNSKNGKKRNLNINENLAREILELHTLGVDGGYNQQDIKNLAYILSGWSLKKRPPAKTAFHKNKHEPGDFTLLNQTFKANKKNNGRNQIHDALSFLSTHPSTAHFICKKLLRHFISDDSLAFEENLQTLVSTFNKTKGNLSSVYLELIKLDSLWESPAEKYKQPDEWLYGIISYIPDFTDFQWIEKKCRELSKPSFAPESPAGWPEDNSTWLTPESLYRQKEIASEAAFRFRKLYQQDAIIDKSIGQVSFASEHTQLALKQCKNKQQTFIALAMCPENLFR